MAHVPHHTHSQHLPQLLKHKPELLAPKMGDRSETLAVRSEGKLMNQLKHNYLLAPLPSHTPSTTRGKVWKSVFLPAVSSSQSVNPILANWFTFPCVWRWAAGGRGWETDLLMKSSLRFFVACCKLVLRLRWGLFYSFYFRLEACKWKKSFFFVFSLHGRRNLSQ